MVKQRRQSAKAKAAHAEAQRAQADAGAAFGVSLQDLNTLNEVAALPEHIFRAVRVPPASLRQSAVNSARNRCE